MPAQSTETKVRKTILILLLGLAQPIAAEGDFILTGEELRTHCRNFGDATSATPSAMYCLGYIYGTLAGHVIGYGHAYSDASVESPPTTAETRATAAELNREGFLLGFCSPGPASGDLVGVILDYIRRHPRQAEDPAANLIYEALREAYGTPPCG